MRAWIYKTDEAGKPRRFVGHGEAVAWALRQMGKVFGALAAATLLSSAVGSYREGRWDLSFAFVALLAAAWLGIWLSISLVLYLFVLLSGGIMDDEARRRYRNNETLQR